MSITKASLIDLNGQELILDADADTSITADTDDQIDIKIAGSDVITLTSSALTFSPSATFAEGIKIDADNGDSPQLLFENSDGVTTDAAISTFDDSNGVLISLGSNFYYNSSGSETRFNTSEESAAVVLNRTGVLSLMTGGTGATASSRLDIDSSGNVTINEAGADADFRIESNGKSHMLFVDGGEDLVLIGTGTKSEISGGDPGLQVSGSGFDSMIGVTRHDANAFAAQLMLAKSRNATVGSNTILQDGDGVGAIGFFADDGTNLDSQVAYITAEIDGTPGANDTPGRLKFSTTLDGAASVSERMRLDNYGQLTLTGVGSGFFVPVVDSIGSYTNNLNAGAFGILHRDSYDSYVTGNCYYHTPSGGSAAWYSKYGNYKSNIISMVNGVINFQASDTGVAANNPVSGLATRASIDSDGLKFGTDTAAANALDDYEESSFNTELVGVTSGTHTTSGSGRMTKIGRLASVLLAADNVGSGDVSGDLRINLPIAYAGHDMYLPVQVYYLNYPADTKTAYAYVSNGYTYVLLYWSRDNNVSLAINSSDLKSGGGSYIRANFNYPTS